MKAGIHRIAVWAASLSLLCCTMSPDEQFVREKIPIEIQINKPMTIHIQSLSGNGWNYVGIRCSPDVWQTLARDNNNIVVNLTSSSKGGTKVIDVFPVDRKSWPIKSFHYLFSIGGDYGTSAAVEITFKAAPQGTTHAEVLVLKTPSDTGL